MTTSSVPRATSRPCRPTGGLCHLRPEGFADLHREMADTTSGAVHQDVLL
ncbi:hypothetical protein ACFTWJ_10245 [Streptomyces anthocyanicus]|jgi:hypothetical protein|nr:MULTISPECIES: hypothetical protein [unclassified Streptomyces]